MSKTSFKITILGSGTMMPTKERNPSCFLVEVGEKKILLDCGHGSMRRMVDYGIDPQEIDLVFISHFHTDHFADAFPLIHARWVEDVYGQKANRSLEFLGPKTLQKRYKAWRQIFWPEKKEKDYPLVFTEGSHRTAYGKLVLETFPVVHVPWFESVGLILEYEGKKIVYTGDIGGDHFFHDLVYTTKNADLLIIETGYKHPTPNHYTIDQTKELMKAAEIKKVLLSHIRPDYVSEAEKKIKNDPQMVLGIDGTVMEV